MSDSPREVDTEFSDAWFSEFGDLLMEIGIHSWRSTNIDFYEYMDLNPPLYFTTETRKKWLDGTIETGGRHGYGIVWRDSTSKHPRVRWIHPIHKPRIPRTQRLKFDEGIKIKVWKNYDNLTSDNLSKVKELENKGLVTRSLYSTCLTRKGFTLYVTKVREEEEKYRKEEEIRSQVLEDAQLLHLAKAAVEAKLEAETNPNNPMSWLKAAEAMESANRHDEAERYRKTALDLDEKKAL